jgi:hypothetical protein
MRSEHPGLWVDRSFAVALDDVVLEDSIDGFIGAITNTGPVSHGNHLRIIGHVRDAGFRPGSERTNGVEPETGNEVVVALLLAAQLEIEFLLGLAGDLKVSDLVVLHKQVDKLLFFRCEIHVGDNATL